MSSALHYDSILARDGAARLKRGAVLALVAIGVLTAMWITGLLDIKRFSDAWPAISQLSTRNVPA